MAVETVRIDNVVSMKLGETRTFSFIRRSRSAQGFLIRHQHGFSAYLNRCCHWPVPLDMDDEDFYDHRIDRIACKTHGATYIPATGECDAGPCVGGQLTAYAVRVDGEDAWVEVDSED